MAYVTVVSNVSCQSRGTPKVKSKFLTPSHEKNCKCKKKNNLSIFHTYKNHLYTSISQFSMILRKNMVFIPM